MDRPKTIQIYLPDGNPRSLKMAVITSRTIQAMYIPRSKLDVAATRSELSNVGVYILIGGEDEDAKKKIYIGEAEDCLQRLKQHNRSKDFWKLAIVILSRTKHFTKTHIKYLEWYCYNLAAKVGRYKLENSAMPGKPHISEPMEADLQDNFETIKILVSTLGYPIFDQIQKPKRSNIIYCKSKDAFAEGEYVEDGLIVFKDSVCNLEETKSAGSWLIEMRKKLIDEGILVQLDNVFKFDSDYIFSSPSSAAAVVLGRRANGWTEWKYKDGRTLDEVIRQTDDD